LHETRRGTANFLAGFLRDRRDRVTAAVEQAEAERHRTHIEVLHLGHGNGLQDFGLGVFHLVSR
jgi:ABC-type transport system involved in cytochrome c biogenesis ATPase subunit